MIATAVLAVSALPVLAGAMDMIPCAVGNKWEFNSYKVTKGHITFQGKTVAVMDDASSGSAVYEVLSVDKNSGPAIWSYAETTKTTSTSGTSNSDRVQLNFTYDNGLMKILSTSHDESGAKKADNETYDPPVLYFDRASAGSGKKWDVGLMRDGDAKNPLSAYGAGRETVTVPAGTFKDCLKVVYVSDSISGTVDIWNKDFNITSGRSRGVYWIAEGIGVVKELEISTSTAEASGPDGTPITVDGSSCTVNELKPGYIVK